MVEKDVLKAMNVFSLSCPLDDQSNIFMFVCDHCHFNPMASNAIEIMSIEYMAITTPIIILS
jgi:hypothetical protein